MQSYTVQRITSDARGRRLWIEGKQPKAAGFLPGMRFTPTVDLERKMLVLELREDGLRKVSPKKEGADRVIPVIDMRSRELLDLFADYDVVRIIARKGRIFILPSATEQKKRARLERLREKVTTGQPLQVGSMSHGGGVLSHAIHEGLARAGIGSRLAFANEIDQKYIEQSAECNPAWCEDTQYVNAPMQEWVFDEYAMKQVPKVDILEAGIPCDGASVAGRAKLGLAKPEDHPLVGHLIVAFLVAIAATQPSIVVLENVPSYGNTASMSIARNQLRDMGYTVHERELDAAEFNCLERRKRFCMVAVTEGLTFDWNDLVLPERTERKLGEILDTLPDDDPSWSPMTGLKAKEQRDIAAGKGFRMQIVDGDSSYFPTLTKDLQKNRSTDPKVRHPRNPGLLRVPTPAEHARAKEVPMPLIQGMSKTSAHEVLGQSVNHRVFMEVARQALAKAIASAVTAVIRRQEVTGDEATEGDNPEASDAQEQLALA